MSIITITKENFTQEVLNADTKVLLDFGPLGAALVKCFPL
jgi:hypothetical protein